MDEEIERRFRRIEAQLNQLDEEALAAQDLAFGARWPLAAICLALVETGAVAKDVMLAIIDHLHAIAEDDARLKIGNADDAVALLAFARDCMEAAEIQPGRVLHTLQHLEESVALDALRRLKPRRG